MKRALCVLLWVGLWAQVGGDELDGLAAMKKQNSQQRLEIDASLAEKKKTLLFNYLKAVEAAKERYQTAGNLEGVLAATKEIESVSKGDVAPIKKSEELPSEIARLREIAITQLAAIDEERRSQHTALQVKFVNRLEVLKQTRTKAGEIESAILVDEEIKRQQKVKTPGLEESLAAVLQNNQWYYRAFKGKRQVVFNADGTADHGDSKNAWTWELVDDLTLKIYYEDGVKYCLYKFPDLATKNIVGRASWDNSRRLLDRL